MRGHEVGSDTGCSSYCDGRHFYRDIYPGIQSFVRGSGTRVPGASLQGLFGMAEPAERARSDEQRRVLLAGAVGRGAAAAESADG
ncbi:hypothetical protein D3C73_1140230 [compost metagenome]